MNLKEIREMVASLVDYDPDVRAYRQEVNRILNETYRNWFVSRPYEFAQKTVDVYSMPDGTIPDATITSSTTEIRNWVQASALDATDSTEVGFVDKFRNAHEGSIVILTDAATATNNGTFIIDKIDFGSNRVFLSKLSSTPQVDWDSATLDAVVGSVNQRFITLPADCTDILQLGIRNLEEAGSTTNSLGMIYNLTRRRDQELNLRYDLTGTPTEFVVYDGYPEHTIDIDQFTPRSGKDFTVDSVANSPAWPEGIYEFKMSYVWRGVESQLSDAFELKLTGTQIPRFNTLDTTKQGFSGLRKKFYVRLKEITGADTLPHEEDFFRDLSSGLTKASPNTGAAQYNFFLIDDDETQVSWNQGNNLEINTISDLFRFARESVNIGYRKRIRLYPRPAVSIPLEIRYIYTPRLLEDDFDKPACPDDTHRYLAYQTCADLFIKHDNPEMATYYQKKAEKELLKIDNKYLTQRSALYIKDSYISGPLRVRPFQRLTRLPDA
jgi:hypothetical protein